jgi:hypothetical protein
MNYKKRDGDDVIYSPERGFWGKNGWDWSLDEADKISKETNLILAFSKKTKAKRVSLSHCLFIDKYDLGVMIMDMAVSLLLKNQIPKELKPLMSDISSFDGLIYIKNKSGELGEPVEESVVQMQIGIRYFENKPTKFDVVNLAKKTLPIDVVICEDGKILVVKHGGERKFEQAPKIPVTNRQTSLKIVTKEL